MNPMAAPADIQIRELQSIANVAHEGIDFSKQFDNTTYYIDEVVEEFAHLEWAFMSRK
jgi:hypothetical protein